MKQHSQAHSVEILIGDLIFKLGKANQQIHQLTQRIAHLEQVFHNQSTVSIRHFDKSRMTQ
ncbi:hypothetical protein [Pseudogracilibacillus auburnensis]|uniref:hypothetical protein n=1 Tax=Pseudogracilibacillus auburnensis TaxID=1494959 RepID=UPI001A972817|nr:hypothetical protein [Pseudogracilibacillus auburnensis]MBO1004770.1 hypothetical protein [Pseudogracilibacillus auburnensis]